jgi:hypothetical protein
MNQLSHCQKIMIENEVHNLYDRLSQIMMRQLMELQDLDFIPGKMMEAYLAQNQQPLEQSPLPRHHLVLTSDGHLGISLTYVLPLYKLALQEFFKIRKSVKDSDLSSISEDQWSMIDSTSRVALLLNPDHHTIWSARKLLLTRKSQQSEKSQNWEMEVKFSQFLLTRHPKKTLIWSHWWWILCQSSPQNLPFKLLESIHPIVQKAGHDYFANYPAWRFLWQVLSSVIKSHTNKDKLSKMIIQEWDRAWKWVQKHPTDPSGHHYLCQICLYLLGEKYLEHLKRLEKLNELYGPRQVIWTHYYSFFEITLFKDQGDVVGKFIKGKKGRDYFPKDKRWDWVFERLSGQGESCLVI